MPRPDKNCVRVSQNKTTYPIPLGIFLSYTANPIFIPVSEDATASSSHYSICRLDLHSNVTALAECY